MNSADFTHDILLFPTSLCGVLVLCSALPPARPLDRLTHTYLCHTQLFPTHIVTHTTLNACKKRKNPNHWFPYLEGRGKACCCHLWFSLMLGKLLQWAVIVGYTVSVPIGHGWLTDIHILPDPGQVRQTNPLPNCKTAMKTDSETKACNIPSGKLTYLLKIAIDSEFSHQKW